MNILTHCRDQVSGIHGRFALAGAAAAGAGYAWATRPYAAELAELRSRVQLADAIARRTMTMNPAERRQFDTLMQWNLPARR